MKHYNLTLTVILQLILLVTCQAAYAAKPVAPVVASNSMFFDSLVIQVDPADAAEFAEIDSFAQNAPTDIDRDSATVANYLLKGCKNDLQKARAVFTWIANNIRYDDNAYNSGKYFSMSAQSVLKRKHAVCEGYSNLYKAIGQAMGLEVEIIDGYAKAYGYRPGQRFTGTPPNHAWNAVKINGEWLLVDATWGAGFAEGGRGQLRSRKAFTPYWFNVNKYEFLFLHYPAVSKWMLIPQAVTLKQYEEMPLVQPAFFQMGFEARNILDQALAKTLPKQLAEVYPTKYHLKLVDFPLSATIPAAASATFTISCNDDIEIVLANDPKQLVRMVHSGNTYTGSLPLKRGELQVAIKTKGRSYSDIVRYKVK